jgi:hypothetical protein
MAEEPIGKSAIFYIVRNLIKNDIMALTLKEFMIRGSHYILNNIFNFIIYRSFTYKIKAKEQ